MNVPIATIQTTHAHLHRWRTVAGAGASRSTRSLLWRRRLLSVPICTHEQKYKPRMSTCSSNSVTSLWKVGCKRKEGFYGARSTDTAEYHIFFLLLLFLLFFSLKKKRLKKKKWVAKLSSLVAQGAPNNERRPLQLFWPLLLTSCH